MRYNEVRKKQEKIHEKWQENNFEAIHSIVELHINNLFGLREGLEIIQNVPKLSIKMIILRLLKLIPNLIIDKKKVLFCENQTCEWV